MIELVVAEGPNRGARFVLAPGPHVLGRAADCQVVLPDEGASRRHARLDVLPGGSVTVTDLGSQNGTTLDGLPLESGATLPALPGHRVGIAATVLVLGDGGAFAPAAAAPTRVQPAAPRTTPGDRPLAEGEAARVLGLLADLTRVLGRDGLPDADALGATLGRALALAGGARAALFVARRLASGPLDASRCELVAATSEDPPALPEPVLPALAGEEARELALASGLTLVMPARGSAPGLALVVESPVGLAVEAWRAVFGALAPAALVLAERRTVRREARAARAARAGRSGLVGKSEPMRRLLQQVARAAPTDAPVLVVGESGTGKELLARAIHDASARAERSFVALNCAAFPDHLLESELFGHVRGAFTGAVALKKGHFELAEGGTLFLDEVGELSDAAQKKLLRVLETGEFYRLGSGEVQRSDVRLVAATNRDLRAAAREGRFREDLYFRLAVLELRVPPLRERGEDRELLVDALLREVSRGATVTVEPAALELLRAHPFPGNVRELRNALERAWILGDRRVIRAADLPDALFPPSDGDPSPAPRVDEGVRARTLEALERAAWNRTRAAELLGIDRRTLYSRVKRFGLGPGASA